MLYNNLCYTVRTSKNQYYKYYLDENKSLIEKLYNTDANSNKSNIIFKNIIEYSIAIDSFDNLNIIYLNSKGELYYSVISSHRTNTKLTQIDLHNFTLKFLELRLIENFPHIFFTIRKNSSENYHLYHNFFSNGEWKSNEITKIRTKKYINPYSIDYSNKNLYIFCQTDTANNYIIKNFNMETNSWKCIDSINIKGCFNPLFFVNASNDAMIYYNNLFKHNILTYVIRKNLMNTEDQWSTPVILSDPNKNSTKPSIIMKDSLIHIMWRDGNYLSYIATDLNGTNIIARNSLNENIVRESFNSIYISSHPHDLNRKNNYSILVIMDRPVHILDVKNVSKKTRKNTNIIKSTSLFITPSNNSKSKDSRLLLSEKDEKLTELIDSYSKFKNNVNSIVNGKSISLIKDEFFAFDMYKSEDELLVGKLNFVITSLCKEISVRDEKISKLNTQINKSFFRKFFMQKKEET